jgi:hypothetical protein
MASGQDEGSASSRRGRTARAPAGRLAYFLMVVGDVGDQVAHGGQVRVDRLG